VVDFSADEGDRIDLSSISGLSGLSDGGTFGGMGVELIVLQGTSFTRLAIDLDGNGRSDVEIDLIGVHSLTDADFLFA
jgi:hypothetical protein